MSLLSIDLNTGICSEAEYIRSPNCDERPEGQRIEAVVLHSISLPPGEYHAGNDNNSHPVVQFFCNGLRTSDHSYYQALVGVTVSAHFFITRDAKLVQFVPLWQRAWHAGESYGLQCTGLNNHSVGIELEGFDEASDGYTDEQYSVLLSLLVAIKRAAPNIGNKIFAHSDIAPGRKTDPGPYFEWSKLSQVLKD